MGLADAHGEGAGTFRKVLKATSLIGGASAINILIGMVRTKIVAILLGPAGLGMLGILGQIMAVASTLAGLGVSQSGVRQIAQAVGSKDQARVGLTVAVLRRTAWATGILGMVTMWAFAIPIARITFGSGEQGWNIGLLGIAVLLGQVAAGHSAVLQGLRRIKDVARVMVLSSIASTMLSIPCYLLLGISGIAIALGLGALATLVVTWWFARQVPIEHVAVRWTEGRTEARRLLVLGSSFVGAGLLSTGSTYLIQSILLHRFDLTGLGLYQAAYSLSGVLANFVLGAMAADYYPRLTAASASDGRVLAMVNEQSQAATLLAMPGLAAMMVLAPIIIHLFFAQDFAAAVPLLRWCLLGVLGRVISWPLGFVILAKGKARLFLVTEAIGTTLHVLMVPVFAGIWGLQGAAAAFAATYVIYTAVMLLVTRRLIGKAWEPSTAQLQVLATLLLAVLALNGALNPHDLLRWTLGVTLAAGSAWACFRQLLRLSRNEPV